MQVMHAVGFENNVVIEDQKVLTTRCLYCRHALANSIWWMDCDVLHEQAFAKPLWICNYSCGLEITARIGNDDFVYRVRLDRERFQQRTQRLGSPNRRDNRADGLFRVL